MSDLDARLGEGRDVVETMHPPADLWAQVEQRASHGDVAVLDLASGKRRRHPALWLAVAAAVALLVVAGALAVMDDDRDIETVPATGGETTTTDTSRNLAFAVPFAFDLPDGWTVDRGAAFHHFIIGSIHGLPQSRIDFAIAAADTPEAALAEINANAPSLPVSSDPAEGTVLDLSATCVEIDAGDSALGATALVQIRPNRGEALGDRAVVLEDGAAGRICVFDAPSHPEQARVPLVVLVQAPSAELPDFLDEADGVLGSIEL